MIQWEYRTQAIKIREFGDKGGKIENILNGHGKEGFELVSSFIYGEVFSFIFKRPIPQPTTAEKIFSEVKNEVEQEGKFGVDWYARPQNDE